jgi:U3 small nucleolar RNA-associated protein MPP10
MSEDQVWSQLDLKAQGVCRILQLAIADTQGDDGNLEMDALGPSVSNEQLEQALQALKKGDDHGSLAELFGSDGSLQFSEEVDSEGIRDSTDTSDMESEEGAVDSEDYPEVIIGLRDQSFSEGNYLSGEPVHKRIGVLRNSRKSGSRKISGSELDDDFFSLKGFNAETEEFEALNVSGGGLAESDDDAEEDEADLFAPVDNQANDSDLEDGAQGS